MTVEHTREIKTTGGKTWTKEFLEGGGKRYRAPDGSFATSQRWAAAVSHTPTAAIRRGEATPEDFTREDLSAPFDVTRSNPAGALEEAGEVRSPGREALANENRFLGFLNSEDTPDDPVEAALEYEDMVRELDSADSLVERENIRERYGVGGS